MTLTARRLDFVRHIAPVLEREKRTTAFEYYVPISCNHAADIYLVLAAYWLQLTTKCGEALKIRWRLIC